MTAIQTSKLGKVYTIKLTRKVVALRNLDLEIKKGEIFGFIGPNGAGKSTTIKLLMNLIRPTTGEASILGVPVFSTISLVVTDQEKRRRKFRNLIAIISAIVVIVFASLIINRFVTPLDIVWTNIQDRLVMIGLPISPTSSDQKQINQQQKTP